MPTEFPNICCDTHAHIYLEEFDKDRVEVIERSTRAGVTKILMPNIDHSSIDRMLDVESRYKEICIPMMGLHPCSVKKDFQRELYLIENWLNKKKFAAIGEIGTDLYWDSSHWDQQKDAFTIQVAWAKERKLPVAIHCRESLDQTIELIKPFTGQNFTGVFHCFSGTVKQAKEIIDMGFYLGIGGVSTYKNGGLDKTLPDLSLDNIVLETDSPYLAPVPYRGKRNEPSYVPMIAERVSTIMEFPVDEVLSKTTINSKKIFKLSYEP